MLLEKFHAMAKGGAEREFAERYSLAEEAGILAGRFAGLLRGLRYRAFWRNSRYVFVGRRVTVRMPWLLRPGRTLAIDDGATIDCNGRSGIVLGDNFSLGRDSIMTCTGVVARRGEGIRIGKNCGIGPMAYLGGQGGIVIGDDVIFGPGARVFSENHVSDDPRTPIRLQGERREAVTIGDDCWIGANAIILAGVRIGRGCVVGAGAVVTRSVEPCSVVGGVPARVLAKRRGCEG